MIYTLLQRFTQATFKLIRWLARPLASSDLARSLSDLAHSGGERRRDGWRTGLVRRSAGRRGCCGGEAAHGHVAMGGALDAAGAEEALGVAVNQQGDHHVRRVLLVAAALVVDGEGAQGQAVHRLDDEVDKVVLRHPARRSGGSSSGVLRSMFWKRWAMVRSQTHPDAALFRHFVLPAKKVRQAP
jgi:hypothetical protein